MKQVLLDANFPRDATGATYHVGTRPGQVANRIITVGDQLRARRIAAHFDGGQALFEHHSQRSFLTLTGTFKGVPITVVSVGMGFSVIDFFIRECRAVVDGEMVIVRLGSCGSIDPSIPIGSVVVPLTSYGITREYDYFHPHTTAEERASGSIEPYKITKPLDCDRELHDCLLRSLEITAPPAARDLFAGVAPKSVGEVINASTDSFYSSQGRLSADFLDANTNLIDVLRRRHSINTLEMETYVLNHLALSANLACASSTTDDRAGEDSSPTENSKTDVINSRRIRTGAVQMIFANRHTSAFIIPGEVQVLEEWAGKAVCESLASLEIPLAHTHKEGIWNVKEGEKS